jgi:hypothetical protein
MQDNSSLMRYAQIAPWHLEMSQECICQYNDVLRIGGKEGIFKCWLE